MAVFSLSSTVPERRAFSGEHKAQKWHVQIVDDPKGRRDDFVKPYFQNAQPDQVVVIIKAREPAGYMVAIGAGKKWHLETKYRWVQQFNFYIQDAEWGPIFVRVCPYFLSPPNLPESALLAGPEDEASGDTLYTNR